MRTGTNLKGKKLLVLGGRTIGTKEIVLNAKRKGIYVIVTDYLPEEKSPAKLIADEAWNISTEDVDALIHKVKEHHVDGILAGVSEFNISRMITICNATGLPCYCNKEQWNILQNKSNFKDLCRENGIPVTKEYKVQNTCKITDNTGIEYPVVVKPADSSSSCGFSICYSAEELEGGLAYAKSFSDTGSVLVEQYMDYRYSVIIHYTVVNGVVYYSGMSDKYSERISNSSGPIMAVQYYSSNDEEPYLRKLDTKVRKMLSSLGFTMGVFWIEAFHNKGEFVFNEMGSRFGGSLTYLPIQYLYGFNQLDLMVEYALTGKNEVMDCQKENIDNSSTYCIFPVHVRKGKINKINGFDRLEERKEIIGIVPVHYIGDQIEDWGSAQQVFAYIHFVVDSREEADRFAKWIMETLHIYDDRENQILFNLHI